MAAAKGKKTVSRKKAEPKAKAAPKEKLEAKAEEAPLVVEEASAQPVEPAEEVVKEAPAQPVVEEKPEPVAPPAPKKEEPAPVPAPQSEVLEKTLKVGASVILPSGREAVVAADADKKGRLLVVRKDNTRKSYLYLPEQLKLV